MPPFWQLVIPDDPILCPCRQALAEIEVQRLEYLINSTSDTAANRTSTAVRTPDTISSCRLPALHNQPGVESGRSSRFSAIRREAVQVRLYRGRVQARASGGASVQQPTPACTMARIQRIQVEHARRHNVRGGPKNESEVPRQHSNDSVWSFESNVIVRRIT